MEPYAENAVKSGADVDIWGDDSATRPLLMPGVDVPCVARDEDGNCPAGCDACRQFLREFDWLAYRAASGIDLGPG